MKKMTDILKSLGLVMALLMIGFAGMAQTETEENTDETETIVINSDTTEIYVGKRKFVIISDNEGKRIEIKKNKDDDNWEEEEKEWDDDEKYNPDYEKKEHRRKYSDVGFLALDLGITDYYANGVYGVDAATPELELKPFRPGSHVALHFLPTTASLINGYVNLKTAITVDWSNYYLVNDVTLLEGTESLAFDTTGVSFSKNKLTTRYAQIPLLLNINTDPGGNDGVSISFGVYGGILWKAWTKQVSDQNGKVKVDGDYNLNPFKYGLMARVDFKWFDIYAMYNLSEVFDEGVSPQTQTFMAGVNLINF